MTGPHTSLKSATAKADQVDERMLASLQPLVLLVFGAFWVFLVYNAVDFDPPAREWAMAHDAFAIVVTGLFLLALRGDKIPARFAHLGGFVLILVVVSNVLLVELVLGDPFFNVYIDVIIIAAGTGSTRAGWAALTYAVLAALAVPVVLYVSPDLDAGLRHVASIGVSIGLSVAIYVRRRKNELRIAELMEQERAHRVALEETLADLDRRVEERTAELKAEIADRERAEKKAQTLSDRLRHAQRLESVGRLAGGVAHDFNNLLAAISGNVEIALEDLPPGIDPEPLEDAQLAARRAVDVTRQLLLFSRKQEMVRQTFDLVERMESMDRLLRRVLGDDLELRIEPTLDEAWVDADPGQIEQVVMNLAVNARDAMPTGGTLTIAVEESDDESAVIRVTDTGTGMSDETKARIFEPFFTTKEVGKGTGLGLSTVYGIVHRHEGSIDVTSEPGAGTTFVVRLPLAERPPEAASEHVDSVPAPTGERTILLVEDEESVRRVAERLLRRAGYSVVAAGSGEEAIRRFEEHADEIDLVWTDVLMPGMSGGALADALRERRPSVPVLFSSGYTGDYLQTRAGGLPEGAALLYKPYDPKHLLRIVHGMIEAPPGAPTRSPRWSSRPPARPNATPAA